MASDNLKQVGKSIRKSQENASYASKKVFLNRRIERSRDVFDTTVPFEMEFRTNRPDDRVSLDLTFNKPPPRKGCTADCFSNLCETFTFTDGGDHLIQLQIDYIPTTVIVFRNREKLSPANFNEYDPLTGQVYVQGISSSDEISICYLTGDCSNTCTCPPPPDLHIVYSNVSLPGLFITASVSNVGGADLSRTGNDAPPTYIHAYAGCTYRLQYTAFWGPTTNLLAVGMLQYPSGANSLGSITLGSPAGGETHFAEYTFLCGADADYDLAIVQTNGTIANSVIGSQGSVTLTWVSGPDPRFTSPFNTQCISCRTKNVIDDRPFEISPGIWQVSLPYVLGTLQGTVNGVPVVITENNPNLGTFIFVTNPHSTDDIKMSYTAQ